MGTRLFRVSLLLLVAAALAAQMIVGPAMGQASKLTWDKDVAVKRVDKPTRRVTHHHAVQHVPPLTIQYRLIKRGKDGVFLDTNASAVFYTGDQVKIGITPNQDGYLYIIHNMEGEDGQLKFPDSRINNGENFVLRNKEYLIPSFCQNVRDLSDPKDCWYTMDKTSGREEFTLIFSRDAITSLPKRAIEGGGRVPVQVIKDLISESGQKIEETSKPQGIGHGRYVIWVQNINKNDNEELIYAIVLTHRGEQTN